MQVSYIMKTNGTISMFIDGKMKSIEPSHVNYDLVVQKLNSEDYAGIMGLIDVISLIKESVNEVDGFSVVGNSVTYKAYKLNDFMSQRLIDMIDKKMNLAPIGKFLDKLYQNPSYRAINSLYEFLDFGGIPITSDGNFLVYKKVQENYKDIHSGTFDNNVGKICSMPRYEVDENPDRTCSSGLHVCSFDYLQHFGNNTFHRVVICEVNPKDVVAIPKDYNNTKMRVSEYKVVGELDEKTVDELRNKYCVSYYDEEYDYVYEEDEMETSSTVAITPVHDVLFDTAKTYLKKYGQASTTALTRRFSIGWKRATKIMQELEDDGFVTPQNYLGKRELV